MGSSVMKLSELFDMTELFKKNQMIHFLPFCNEFFVFKFNFKNCKVYSGVIYGLKLCKRDGIMKMRLAIHTTKIVDNPLKLSFLFE